MAVFPGRYAAQIEGDFVVFVIGMRINRPLKVRQWLPVFAAMPKMIRELEQDPSDVVRRPKHLFTARRRG